MSETVKAVITPLDNLPMLKEQVHILRDEPLSEIIIVNNGSEDGTTEWVADQSSLTIVNRENFGAGPGRNAGLDKAHKPDYYLLLDGGIRPLRGSVAAMLAYLNRHPEVDIISPEIATCFTTDERAAHRRMSQVDDKTAFPQRALSSTAYALCRARAWDGLRFSEEGPFGQAGWGVDDNEMACRWNEAGIVHHDFNGIKVYRRQSGSFARLFRETGIWPTQYGSVYEQRNVMLAQTYPQYYDPTWCKTKLELSCILVGQDDYPAFAERIKALHEELVDVPHEVIFVDNASIDQTQWWLDTFALRWHWSNTTIDAQNGQILRLTEQKELIPVWTGNVVRVDLPERVSFADACTAGTVKARSQSVRLVK